MARTGADGADATDAPDGPDEDRAWRGFEYQDREVERQDREREQKDREIQRAQAERDRESSLYEQGNNAIYEGRWDRAVTYFTRLADLKGTRADSALYWKSYAQNRLGQRADALATIGELTKSYPNSRYLKEAKALEVEVRGSDRAARAARSAGGRGAEAHRHQRPRPQRSGAGGAAPREAAVRHGVPTAQGPGALRAGADQHAARPRSPPERVNDGLQDAGAILGAAAIGENGQHLRAGLAPDPGSGFGKARIAPGRDRDARAFLGQRAGDAVADAHAGAARR